jgi:hypothetical protein
VVKLLASLSSFMMRCTNGNIIGVIQELKPSKNQDANFRPIGTCQIRRQMLQKSSTIPAKVNGIQIGYTL